MKRVMNTNINILTKDWKNKNKNKNDTHRKMREETKNRLEYCVTLSKTFKNAPPSNDIKWNGKMLALQKNESFHIFSAVNWDSLFFSTARQK